MGDDIFSARIVLLEVNLLVVSTKQTSLFH